MYAVYTCQLKVGNSQKSARIFFYFSPPVEHCVVWHKNKHSSETLEFFKNLLRLCVRSMFMSGMKSSKNASVCTDTALWCWCLLISWHNSQTGARAKYFVKCNVIHADNCKSTIFLKSKLCKKKLENIIKALYRQIGER